MTARGGSPGPATVLQERPVKSQQLPKCWSLNLLLSEHEERRLEDRTGREEEWENIKEEVIEDEAKPSSPNKPSF